MIVQNKSLEIQLFVHYSYTKCCRHINALPSLPWINSGIKPELPRVLYWWLWLRWESLLLLLLWVSLDGSSSPSSSSIAGWWCRMIIVLITPLDHIQASRWPPPHTWEAMQLFCCPPRCTLVSQGMGEVIRPALRIGCFGSSALRSPPASWAPCGRSQRPIQEKGQEKDKDAPPTTHVLG